MSRAFVAVVVFALLGLSALAEDAKPAWQISKVTLTRGSVLTGLVLDEPGKPLLIDDGTVPMDFARSSVDKIETLPEEDAQKVRAEIAQRRETAARLRIEQAEAAAAAARDEALRKEADPREQFRRRLMELGEGQRLAALEIDKLRLKEERNEEIKKQLTDEIKLLNDARGIFLPKLEMLPGSIGVLSNALARNEKNKVVNASTSVKVSQVVDAQNMICVFEGKRIWIKADTANIVDGAAYYLDGVFKYAGTKQYARLNGANKTVYMIEEIQPTFPKE